MIKIWEKARHWILPKRIYYRGTLGLACGFDDRNKLEKILDAIEGYIERIDKYFERKKYQTKYVWRTYFDPSTGQDISSYAQIREIEKMGKTYTTYREIEENAKKWKRIKEAEHRKKSRHEIRKKLHEVAQGRSFRKEIIEKSRNEDINHKANRLRADKYRHSHNP